MAEALDRHSSHRRSGAWLTITMFRLMPCNGGGRFTLLLTITLNGAE